MRLGMLSVQWSEWESTIRNWVSSAKVQLIICLGRN